MKTYLLHAKGEIKLAEQKQMRIDEDLLNKLRPMKNNDMRSINAVIWHLKKEYDENKEESK